MESIHTTINKELVIELFKTRKIASIVFLVFGLIGFISNFVIHIIIDYNQTINIIITFIFALMWVGGIAYLISIKKNIREFGDKIIESDATFYDDYINIISYNGDIQIEDVKQFYKDFLFFKEKKEHVLIYINRFMAVPYTKKEGLVEFLKSKGVKKK